MTESTSEPRTPRAGLVILHSGEGKGKTTAAFGLAMRMVGRGWRVLVLQFFKGPLSSGERIAARRLAPDLTVQTLGQGYVFMQGGRLNPQDTEHARQAWQNACKAVTSDLYDAVVLDEVNELVSLGLVSVAEVLDLIEKRPAGVTLVLTGRYTDPLLVERADIVTEMKCIKHIYAGGRTDLPGIEQ